MKKITCFLALTCFFVFSICSCTPKPASVSAAVSSANFSSNSSSVGQSASQSSEYTVVPKTTITGQWRVTYPQLSGMKNDVTQKELNKAIAADALYSPGAYSNDKSLSATLTYQITFVNQEMLSIKYTGTGTTPNLTKGAQSPIQFQYGSNVDLVTGSLLYISNIYGITNHFVTTYIDYANKCLPVVLDHPFSASAGGVIEETALEGATVDYHMPFYFNGNNLVILTSMWDNQYYPVTIPLSEVAQDVKSGFVQYFGVSGLVEPSSSNTSSSVTSTASNTNSTSSTSVPSTSSIASSSNTPVPSSTSSATATPVDRAAMAKLLKEAPTFAAMKSKYNLKITKNDDPVSFIAQSDAMPDVSFFFIKKSGLTDTDLMPLGSVGGSASIMLPGYVGKQIKQIPIYAGPYEDMIAMSDEYGNYLVAHHNLSTISADDIFRADDIVDMTVSQ